MFLLHFLLIKRNYFIFNLCNFLFDTDQSATFPLFDSLKTYAVFLHQDRQLSWWFYIFQQDTQFWYNVIGNFHDDFMFLTKWHHFHTKMGKFPDDFMAWTRYAIFIRWIFCIFWVPYERVPYEKKWIVTIDTARFSWPEATKTWKSWKIDWRKNCVMAAIWHLLSFLFLLHFTSLSPACSLISHETRSEKGEH